jgi:hypothetical protein
MQNPTTGEMERASSLEEARQKARKFTPPAAVFSIGEVVEVKGGRFRVAAIGKRFIRLESLPRE